MTAGIIAAVLIFAAALIYIVKPLLRADAAESERVGAAVSEVRDLSSRRDMLLASLKDLDDDRATGKVDDRDYEELKARLSAEAVEIMKQLDALDQASRDSTPVAIPTPKTRSPGSPA